MGITKNHVEIIDYSKEYKMFLALIQDLFCVCSFCICCSFITAIFNAGAQGPSWNKNNIKKYLRV